uniref:Signal recognition particle protein n=1 Tax=Leptospirillum ferrodiazotrophum TaxID=412449 RepID=C6HV24_9BACT|nr:MAG: signal recognition particle protein [Leptospirillum ferrodiazotrophum]
MFESLTGRLEGIFKKLTGRGGLTEQLVGETLEEIRVALLEADVSLDVVKSFTEGLSARLVGQAQKSGLTGAQQVIAEVYQEMVHILGDHRATIALASKPPTIIFMMGLQGSGKTTTAAKLALHFKGQNRRVLLVASDLARLAAIDQLKVLGEQIGVPVLLPPDGTTRPSDLYPLVKRRVIEGMYEVVIVDTAGRLTVDSALMGELKELRRLYSPKECLLVVDAMQGQEAVGVAKTFDAEIGVDGVVFTKLDGDTRGGAVLSIRQVLKKPIKFVGMGEKLDRLEAFFPDRMASRIIGMGDIQTLLEKAKNVVSQDEAEALARKMGKNKMDLDDFLQQIQSMKKIGSIDDLMGMIPGAASLKAKIDMGVMEAELKRVEAMIFSMTKKERANPDLIDGNRRKRIAQGSGTSVQQVNQLLRQFDQARRMMKTALKTKGSRSLRSMFPF